MTARTENPTLELNFCHLAIYTVSCDTAVSLMSYADPAARSGEPGFVVPPDLSNAGTRAHLTSSAIPAMIRLADMWKLTSAEACALLGDLSGRTWFRMKAGTWTGTLSQDTLTRISVLLGIFKGLRLLFSEPLCDDWVRLPNSGPMYQGRRPLDAMVHGGIPRMLEVRRHIDALRGGL